jgi:hypothetical protein
VVVSEENIEEAIGTCEESGCNVGRNCFFSEEVAAKWTPGYGDLEERPVLLSQLVQLYQNSILK